MAENLSIYDIFFCSRNRNHRHFTIFPYLCHPRVQMYSLCMICKLEIDPPMAGKNWRTVSNLRTLFVRLCFARKFYQLVFSINKFIQSQSDGEFVQQE